MTHTILEHVSRKELDEIIAVAVRREVRAMYDKPVSKGEVRELWGCSMGTVDKEIRNGTIRPIKATGHKKFSRLEVMGHTRFAERKYL